MFRSEISTRLTPSPGPPTSNCFVSQPNSSGWFLREGEGSSVTKDLRKLIGRTSSTRADKVFGHFFVAICGEKPLASIGGKRYMLLICDDFSYFIWAYYVRQMFDTVACFGHS